MKPHFTDQHKYPRGYVRSESTNIAKTWAAVRKKLERDKKQPEGNVRKLNQAGGARS